MFRLMLLLGFTTASLAPLNAEVVYDVFFRIGATEQIDQELIVGAGTIINDVSVIFRESIDTGDSPVVGNSQLGGAAINIAAIGGTGQFTNVATTTAFNVPSGQADSDTIAGAAFGVGPAFTETRTGVFDTVVGSLRLVAPSGPDQRTQFSLSDFDPRETANNFRGIAGQAINDQDIRFRSLTLVTAIPEPSAALLLACGSAGLILRRRRR